MRLIAAFIALWAFVIGEIALAQAPDQPYFAGTSGGSANAQTITIYNMTAYIPGVPLRFIPSQTNTSATTLNVSYNGSNFVGAVNIFKKTANGITALTGGELIAGQINTVTYDGTQFELDSPGPGSQSVAITSTPGSTTGYCGQTVLAGGAAYYAITLTSASTYAHGCSITIVDTDTATFAGKQLVANGLPTQILWPGQARTYRLNATNNGWVQVGDPGRWHFPPNTGPIVYVNPSASPATCGTTGQFTCAAGSDSNDGLTPNSPLADFNTAIAEIFSQFDLAQSAVFINFAHGTSTAFAGNCIGGALLGNVTINVVGDSTAPTAVQVVAPNSNNAFFTKDGCSLSEGSLAVSDQGSSVGAFSAGNGGVPGGHDLRSITITGNWNTSSTIFAAGPTGSVINMLGPATVGEITNTIASTSTGQIFNVSNGGFINFSGFTIAIPSAITIGGSQAFAFFAGGYMGGLSTGTFTGSGVAGTTGKRCTFDNGYMFDLDPNTAFPGNTNCVYTTNGLSSQPNYVTLTGTGTYTPTSDLVAWVRLILVGGGGAGGSTGGAGNAGGTTSISGLSVGGGAGGTYSASGGVGGAGGTTLGGGYFNASGHAGPNGGFSINQTGTTNSIGTPGGISPCLSPFGDGGAGGTASGTNTTVGQAAGGGSGSCLQYVAPASTLSGSSYSVGAGGTVGSSTGSPGAGQAGTILVEEHKL